MDLTKITHNGMAVSKIVRLHALWLIEHKDGVRANLQDANLHDADLQGADLRCANLRDANLRGADLRDANLRRANLQGANLRDADLQGAVLKWANLHDADLQGADLQGANLQGADLRGIQNLSPLVSSRLSILPDEGAVIGWKKCKYGVIVKLEIPDGARRSNATGRKCRAEFADVLQVIGAEYGVSQHDGKTEYRVGHRVTCDEWCEDRWNECAGGIHFFITRVEAENY